MRPRNLRNRNKDPSVMCSTRLPENILCQQYSHDQGWLSCQLRHGYDMQEDTGKYQKDQEE